MHNANNLDSHLLNVYNKFNFQPIKGVNEVYLCDNQNTKYLDFISGMGINILGYGNKIIEDAIINQLHNGFLHQSDLYHNNSQEKLANKLSNIVNITDNNAKFRTFFCNSGLESTDNAITVVRKYAH